MANPFRNAGDLPFRVGDRLTDFSSVDVTVERVASGGFGAVALGPDVRWSGRWRALKTLRRHLLDDAHVRELFVREALTWKGLWLHANVLTAQFVVNINSLPVLVLDYAAHGSLRDQLQKGWLRWQAVLSLAQQTLAGLAYLHTPDPTFLRPQPIVHRDLKPENVLLDEYNYAIITDFGLAKVVAEGLTHGGNLPGGVSGEENMDDSEVSWLSKQPVAPHATQAYRTARGVAMGTLPYMAPEQWDDAASAGPPADVYAAGLLIVELLTRRHPLFPLEGRHTAQEWRQSHREAASRLPALETLTPANMRADWPDGLATEVAEIARRCLAREPQMRPTAQQALTLLQQLATQLGEQAYISPEVYAHTPEHEMIIWNGWANAYWNFGRNEEALVRNDRALALASQHPTVLLNRGNILLQLRRYAEAEDAYQLSLAARPSIDTEGRGRVWNMLGLLRMDQALYTEAEAAYAQAVTLYPSYAGAWLNRANNARQWAIAEEAAGRRAQARIICADGIGWANEALSLNPNDPDTQQLLAMLREVAARMG